MPEEIKERLSKMGQEEGKKGDTHENITERN